MEIVASSNDPVRLSFLEAVLRDAGMQPVIYDSHMAVVEGSIGAIMRRIAVPSEKATAAWQLLREAGLL